MSQITEDGMQERQQRTIHGYKCEAVRYGSRGYEHLKIAQREWWCGYVTIPPTHPIYRLTHEYDAVPLDCHGGLTFGKITPGGFKVGFDCNHYGDTAEMQNAAYVWNEIESMVSQLEAALAAEGDAP